jgi:hypothetical protein
VIAFDKPMSETCVQELTDRVVREHSANGGEEVWARKGRHRALLGLRRPGRGFLRQEFARAMDGTRRGRQQF